MALQVYSAAAAAPMVASSIVASCAAQQLWIMRKQQQGIVCVAMKRQERKLSLRVKASLEAAPVAEVGQVTQVTKDTFWPIVKAAGDKTVVLDMYTQWCGPCKIIAPKFQQLSEKYSDVLFLKLDCNQDNRPLAKELGIKVVPTFKIFKDSKIVKEVTGAKLDDLVVAIEAARSTT